METQTIMVIALIVICMSLSSIGAIALYFMYTKKIETEYIEEDEEEVTTVPVTTVPVTTVPVTTVPVTTVPVTSVTTGTTMTTGTIMTTGTTMTTGTINVLLNSPTKAVFGSFIVSKRYLNAFANKNLLRVGGATINTNINFTVHKGRISLLTAPDASPLHFTTRRVNNEYTFKFEPMIKETPNVVSQKWDFVLLSDNTYSIQSRSMSENLNKLYLTYIPKTTSTKPKLTLSIYDVTNDGQKLKFSKFRANIKEDSYFLRTKGALKDMNLCIDDAKGVHCDQVWNKNVHDGAKFSVQPAGNGKYSLLYKNNYCNVNNNKLDCVNNIPSTIKLEKSRYHGTNAVYIRGSDNNKSNYCYVDPSSTPRYGVACNKGIEKATVFDLRTKQPK